MSPARYHEADRRQGPANTWPGHIEKHKGGLGLLDSAVKTAVLRLAQSTDYTDKGTAGMEGGPVVEENTPLAGQSVFKLHKRVKTTEGEFDDNKPGYWDKGLYDDRHHMVQAQDAGWGVDQHKAQVMQAGGARPAWDSARPPRKDAFGPQIFSKDYWFQDRIIDSRGQFQQLPPWGGKTRPEDLRRSPPFQASNNVRPVNRVSNVDKPQSKQGGIASALGFTLLPALITLPFIAATSYYLLVQNGPTPVVKAREMPPLAGEALFSSDSWPVADPQADGPQPQLLSRGGGRSGRVVRGGETARHGENGSSKR